MTPADAGAVAALLDELGYPPQTADVEARIRDLSDLGQLLLVAETAGGLVGWIHVQERPVLTDAPWAEIEGLVVSGRARRQGVGRALVEAAESWARERHHASLRVRSRVDRAESHPFYESLGFSRTKTQHVYRKVPAWPQRPFGKVY